jgi:hypothetical protein
MVIWLCVSEPTDRQSIMVAGLCEQEAAHLLVDRKQEDS